MRQVDAEGDSRGFQGQKRTEAGSRSRLRKAAIEWLERRELLSTSTSTLPSPTVLVPPTSLALSSPPTVSQPTINNTALTAFASANTPSVSVDPINPLKMVAVWVDHDAAGYNPGFFTAPITNYLAGSYSLDGGQTWKALSLNSVNVQQDFSVVPPTTTVTVFTQTTDATVRFDRNENFYVLSSTHKDDNTAGVLDLQRFTFNTANPAPAATNPITRVYSWDEADSKGKNGTVDAVVTPTLAVDTNVPTFTDPTTGKTQTDQYSGNVYAVWAEIDSNTYGGIPGFTPNAIRMSASSNQGVSFTHAAYVDNTSNANNFNATGNPLHGAPSRYAAPQVTVSQGNVSGTVIPGQVTVVYDDYGTQAPRDRILAQSDTLGGTSDQFSPAANLLGAGTFATGTVNGTTVITQQNLNQNIPVNVNITDPKFTTLQALDITTTIDYATMQDLTVRLYPPAAVNTYLASKVANYPGYITLYSQSLTGANLGATSGTLFGNGSGTVFDPEAVRRINDGNVAADAVGHFKPAGGGEAALLALQGLGAMANGALPGLNGTWNFLASYDPTVDTSTTLRYVNGVTLNFSSGNDPGFNSATGKTTPEVTVADQYSLFYSPGQSINPTNPAAAASGAEHARALDGVTGTNVSGSGNVVAPTQGAIPILPAPVIASDNTLGSFSQYEGRLYVAFVGAYSNSQSANTDIFLAWSDDGGQTWTSDAGTGSLQQINDDLAATDGLSASTVGGPLGRTQYEPQIAVDPSTGKLVVSFLDARNDPSDARVVTYIAASNDGGQTFAPEVYANPTATALNAVTDTTVNLGPVPDNQSSASGVQDTSGYGTHQALVVTNGQITAFWASNQNLNTKLAIVDSILSLSAGPRIISSTQGPVGLAGDVLNVSKSADGTTLANTIQVTFDAPIDPGTFGPTNVAVYYQSPAGGASVSLPIVSVLPLDANAFGAVNFLITFNPASLANTTYGYVGTYSYVVYPTGNPNGSPTGISDRIRHVVSGGAIANGNVMDQNASGVPGQPHDDDYVVGKPVTVPVTYSGSAATISAGSTLMAPIVITDNYLFQNAVLSFNITYANDSDLTAFLLAPDGMTKIPLFTKVGGSGANFTNTVLTDSAATSIDAGTAPFTGSFQSETPFATLVADQLTKGFTSLGTWTLVIQNAGTSTGTLNNWSLTFQPPQTNFISGTLPLIVPGPHLTSTVVVDSTGKTISSGTNNLVLNNTVSSLQVTWDRNIQVSSFTPDQILSIIGPAGSIPLTGLTIRPLSVYSSGGQMAYTNGAFANVFLITFPTQQLSGTYSVTLGTGISALSGGGTALGVDANENAGLDALKGTATNGQTAPVTYTAASPAVPATIQPATFTANGSTPSILMSPINIPDNFLVQGDVNGIPGITLTLNISYPVDPNLIVYLEAPNGTQVRLFTNVGAGTNTANFSTTTFSDYATTPIKNAGAPFFGTFNPEQPLATFNTDGESSFGTWNLVIVNGGNFTGTLNSWSMILQKPISGTGLAEFPEDQTHTSFQIFNLAASNALANSTWTAVGPAGITTVGSVTPVSFTTASTVAPAPILAGTAIVPSVFTSPINIPANLGFPIQGDTTTVPGVSLSLNLAYLDTSQLAVYLLAPDGKTRINLINSGLLASPATAAETAGRNFINTTLSDVGGTNLSNGAAPYAGTFTPDQSLNALSTAGLYTSGTWTLVIENFGTQTGTFDNWSLTFEKPAATFSGAASTIAVDPSDKTGNTVFLGSASGGIWKTTNFLTTNPTGPTYVPLTQFGPNFSLNIGSIATFGVNNDPTQTVIFAGTGFGQEATTNNNGTPNVNLNSGRGVGIIRSIDGGVTWKLLDSLINTNPDGTEITESLRDHAFVGDTTYKIVVDPRPQLNGQIIVYAALGGPTGGLYQSLDSGNTWKLLQAGTCTDVVLDPNSKSPTTGNLDTIYAAFSTAGVYISTNQGQTLQLMTGELGKNPLITGPGFPANPIPVNSGGITPNFINNSYIVLGKPSLTSDAGQNIAYQGWLYAAVENGNGTFNGLYVTKDAGQNWTLVQLPNIPGAGSVKAAVPTNDTTGANSLDPTSSQFNQEGAYNLTLTVDPTNPNIVYLGGSANFQSTGMIRVNLTDLYDAHNFTSFSNSRTDGGLLNVNAQGGVTVTNPGGGPATYNMIPNILNLRYAPGNPFDINATLVVQNTQVFLNDGTGVTWTPFDEPLKANAGDPTGSTNIHDVINYVDPITGDVRFLIANDMGIFTALVNPDGTMFNGIGTDGAANYSRNGNLQDEQILASAAQPSYVATQAAGALFYASGLTNLAAQSAANILTTGNLTWDNSAVLTPSQNSPRNTTANGSISTSDRSGVGIATDSTGGSAVYEYDIPILGGNLTDFFRVNQNGRANGLADTVNQSFPRQGYNGDAQVSGYTQTVNTAVSNGQLPLGNFEVNPLNGNQILIGSATGNLYETFNQGIAWSQIGNAAEFQVNNTGSFTPIQFSAIAYGAPDPNAQGGVGNLDNFIYVGTSGSALPTGTAGAIQTDGLAQNDGRIFITQAGGQGWTNISSGLDGSSIVGIYPDPDRGSHAAYAVTLTGVFFSPDTVALSNAGQTVWTNITSNLTSIQYNPFGNAVYQQSVLAPFVGQTGQGSNRSVFTSQYGGFTSVVADYRYEIPAPTNATQGTNIFYPALYVSGYGGVFRSIDNGATWSVFPNTSFDAAPVDGGYLPSVDVTNLQLVLGNIDPNTGHATQASNSTIPGATPDPEILLASTFGAGDYVIRLAPDVIPNSVGFDPNQPSPYGSDSSGGALITNVLEPFIDGVSEITKYGNVVTINLIDESRNPDGTPTAGFGTILGTGQTDALGQFVHFDPATGLYDLPGIQIVDSGQDPTFFTSSTASNDKTVGIRATDSAGASGNLTLFSYTLDTIIPNTPQPPVLEQVFDTGRFNNDNLTNLSVPAQAGPGAPLTIVTPTFDVTTPLPEANPLTPNPISLTVELLRATSPLGPFFVIDQTQTGFINGTNTAETYMLTDPTIAAMALNGIDQTFYYEALQIDEAGNVSTPASDLLTITVNTIAPATPTGISLVSNGLTTTPPMPVFSVTGVLPNDQVLLYRSLNGAAPILVSSLTDPTTINTTNAPATLQVTDTAGATPDGVYTYYAAQLDVYGNFSPLMTSSSIVVTINTQTPPAAPILEAGYDTGRSNSDNLTDIAVPAPTPGVAPTFVSPVFDVNTVAPATGQPPITTIELYRSASGLVGSYVLVGTAPFSGNPGMVTDTTIQALVANAYANGTPINQNFYYEADQINQAGITSAKSPALKILIDTITPATMPAPTLDASSNTGLNKSSLITNQTKPSIDFTNLLPGNQAFLYRSSGGKPAIVVGQSAINTSGALVSGVIQDSVGAVPDGVYQYYVVQQDVEGNISNYSQAVPVTVNTTFANPPTIALLASDDTGLPSHPNVTSVVTPHFVGTAQYNSVTNFPVDIINVATGAVLTSMHFYPAANGTYQAQITNPLPAGTYTVEARSTNLAGNFSYSAPLTITIIPNTLSTGPSLMLSPATDTGIKGDGVTSNHAPVFIGTTAKGDTVAIYVLVNGVLQGPVASGTSSTINGSFSIQLPFNLTDGTTQLFAQTSDIANNLSPIGPAYTIQIVTTAGDYLGTGKAQLSVFDPYNETYYVRGYGAVSLPNPAGEDVPIQYDFNGDGKVDPVGYKYDLATYFGFLSNNSAINYAYGPANQSLPVSGYYGNSGTFLYGSYAPASGTWYVSLPTPGGLVLNFGVPRVDIPVPAAYNGFNSTELAVFRNTPVFGGDGDSFSVIGPQGFYQISFTSPAVQKLGFVYKPGDVAAPADYDGLGRDEFAIYRPSTGQFFILNTPSDTNTATWTLRTVTMNLPGGPSVNDVPVSEDYEGNGKADPTVYRPSNSTFYMLSSTTGIQTNIPFGPANQSIASAGPILYRLNALLGPYASNGGYYGIITTAGGANGSLGGGSGGLVPGAQGGGGGSSNGYHAESIASASASTLKPSASSTTASSPLSTMIAITAPVPIASTTPVSTVVPVSVTIPQTPVTVGASTPKTIATVTTGSKRSTSTIHHAHKANKPLVVDTKSHQTESKTRANLAKTHSQAPARVEAHAPASTSPKTATTRTGSTAALSTAAMQHLVMAVKGGKNRKK